MKIIRVISRATPNGRNIASMRIIQDDPNVTDESRNTVYNVMRQMPKPTVLVWDIGTWDNTVYE